MRTQLIQLERVKAAVISNSMGFDDRDHRITEVKYWLVKIANRQHSYRNPRMEEIEIGTLPVTNYPHGYYRSHIGNQLIYPTLPNFGNLPDRFWVLLPNLFTILSILPAKWTYYLLVLFMSCSTLLLTYTSIKLLMMPWESSPNHDFRME